jgi:four helix bundle protein
MDAESLKSKSKAFALRIIRLCEALSKSVTGDVIRRQLLRCGTSVGANYRAACRARSQADFVAKMGIVEEEYDESMYWMDLAVEAGIMNGRRIAKLRTEANEILSMVIASIKTARKRSRASAIRTPQSAIDNTRSVISRKQMVS